MNSSFSWFSDLVMESFDIPDDELDELPEDEVNPKEDISNESD